MPKIDAQTSILKTYEIEPIKDRLNTIEGNTSKEKIQSICSSVFGQKLKEEDFFNKIDSLFNKALKQEHFINKVKSIASKEIKDYIQGKLVWAAVIWIITIIVSILVQKFFKIF